MRPFDEYLLAAVRADVGYCLVNDNDAVIYRHYCSQVNGLSMALGCVFRMERAGTGFASRPLAEGVVRGFRALGDRNILPKCLR